MENKDFYQYGQLNFLPSVLFLQYSVWLWKILQFIHPGEHL